MTGQTISHYRILAKLGEGAMGVVYRAEDTKLRRTVALKFLPDADGNAALRDRFLREAQAAAALNHPNICTIFEIDEERAFLAMELVEGPSLKDKIAERPLKLDEALDFASQIAAGLQAAHDKGVTHRDIKPANILLTQQGQVKITDFGLAALADRTRITKTGTSMGTPAYMSPEQAKGEPLDRRTDLWSLGVVLYEMLTGRLPFAGDTEQAVSYGIVHTDPEPPTALRSGLPVEIDRVTAKALAKDPSERYQNAADLQVDLRVSRPGAIHAAPIGPRRATLPWVVAAAVASIALTLWVTRPTYDAAQTLRTVIPLPEDQFMVAGYGALPMALSPDGAKLVYAASRGGGRPRLYLRDLGEFEPRLLPGTEGGTTPFFSADSRWIGFAADRKLKKVAVWGGAPIEICDAPDAQYGADWGSDDTIIYATAAQGIWRVSASGGTPQQLTKTSGKWPRFLPDGKGILFTTGLPDQIAVLPEGQLPWRILAKGKQAFYSASGHLLYADGGGILSARFDPKQAKLLGPAVSMVDDVYDGFASGATYFTVSHEGTLYYVPGRNEHSLVWIDRTGRVTPATSHRRGYRLQRLSPDGKRTVVVIDPPDEGQSDIWIHDIERDSLTRLTSEGALTPHWSPDGARVVYMASRQGDSGAEVYWRHAGGGIEERVLLRDRAQHIRAWSADGKFIFFYETVPATRGDIWAISLAEGRALIPVAVSKFEENYPSPSPDGRWVALQSDESGQDEIYVQPFPSGGRTLISSGGGAFPAWAPKGNEIFYVAGSKVMTVPVTTQPTFRAGKPELLFDRFDVTAGRSLVLSPTHDGSRFLMVQWDPLSSPRSINVVQNWFAELRAKAGN
jgi:Tol biopolymer transport system component/predicted Ser/Thr protein kinase